VIDGDSYSTQFNYLTLVRILIAQGHLDDAQELLGQLLERTQGTGRTTTEIEANCLLALIIQAQGDIDQAITILENALSRAEPCGFIRIFVDEGPTMARLLYEALSRGIMPVYVHRLLAAFSDAPVAEPEPTIEVVDTLIESLSERELEVLHLIAEGLTNAEIASRLYLALNIIKVHTRNIYGKLGVNNRVQAVDTARRLGLLSPI
jgi:LuxR family maltose regulon positive regulatory protein